MKQKKKKAAKKEAEPTTLKGKLVKEAKKGIVSAKKKLAAIS